MIAGDLPAGRVLVLGGARSGKSRAAEGRLGGADRVDYVAPGPVPGDDDPEWAGRVAAHRERRPAGWTTHETADLGPLLATGTSVPMLLDCLATWLTAAMDDCGVWEGRPGGDAALAGRIDALVEAWSRCTRPLVAVSSEVGCGVVPATAAGRRFRDELGLLNSRIAAVSDEVWLLTAGIPQRLR